jgi:hypothetical protein
MQLPLRDPAAGVAHRQLRAAVARAQPHVDRARGRRGERVRRQVDDDLLPHAAIDGALLAERRAVHHQTQPRRITCRAERLDEIRRERCEIARRGGRLRVGRRRIAERVEDLQQLQRVAACSFEHLAAAGHQRRRRALQNVLERKQQQGQRRADVAREMGEVVISRHRFAVELLREPRSRLQYTGVVPRNSSHCNLVKRDP